MMEKSSVKKNFFYQMIYEVLVFILPFITSPYIARVIGAEFILVQAVNFADDALDPVAPDCASKFHAHRNAQPSFAVLIAQRINHQAVGGRGAPSGIQPAKIAVFL